MLTDQIAEYNLFDKFTSVHFLVFLYLNFKVSQGRFEKSVHVSFILVNVSEIGGKFYWRIFVIVNISL